MPFFANLFSLINYFCTFATDFADSSEQHLFTVTIEPQTNTLKNKRFIFNAIMRKTLLTALTIIVTGILSASAQTTASDVLFSSSNATYPYRIPAIATLKDGKILAISDYRPCYKDVGNGEVDMYARIGTLNSEGKYSWDSETCIADGTSSNGYGDAALVVDRESGDAIVICVSGKVVYGNGSSTNHNGMARIVRSAETGEWSTSDVSGTFFSDAVPTAHTMFMASGRMIQSTHVNENGHYRIYGALLVDGSEGEGNYVVYSDDLGINWQPLGGMCIKGGNEAKLEELPNGDLLISSRANGGRYFNVYSQSQNNWLGASEEIYNFEGKVASVSNGSGCNGELLFYKGLVNIEDGKIYNVMLQSLPAGTSGKEKRSKVTVFYKVFETDKDSWTANDFTSGWELGKEIDSNESAYSTMTILPNGNIGFLYEAGEVGFSYQDNILGFIPTTQTAYGYDITFCNLTVSEITGGAYKNASYDVKLNGCTINGETMALATFSAPVPTACPTGVSAYYIKAMENGYAKLEAIPAGKTIPADAGVILAAETEGTYTMTGVGEFMNAQFDGNLLVGSSNNEVTFDASTTGYILKGDGNGGVAFYSAKANTTLGTNKAYLKLDGASESTGIRISFDGTTDINEIESENVNAKTIYDLYGRRVNEMLPGNIYIVNGKKILVK